MAKIKLTTVSGQVIEKPVVTSFKNNNGEYLVLDNESIGTMGLPIILVCKIFGDKLIKIIDQGEWQGVKESLKAIISGKSQEYLTTKNEMSADDVFFTQLTLPVNSFDMLKKNYVVPATAVPAQPEPVVEPQIMDTPIQSEQNPIPKMPDITPVMPQASVAPQAPVMDFATPEPVVTPQAPIMPEMETTPVNMDIMDTQTAGTSTVTPVMPTASTPIDFTELKATFMKSCEDMFDALVIKLQNK
jgi:hypothetical protein